MNTKEQQAWHMGHDDGFEDAPSRLNRWKSEETRNAYSIGYAAGVQSADAYYTQQKLEYSE